MQLADATQILFSSSVTLRNVKEHKFLKSNNADGQVTATGLHPLISYSDSESSQQFIIINSQNKDYKGLVTFGSAISLTTSNGGYLSFNANKEVKIEKSESAANNKLVKWTIFSANNPGIKRPVTCYDDIVLKTPFGELIVDATGVVSANGQGSCQESTWKIMRANVPFIPDWVFTRPNLNHNDLVLNRSPYTEVSSKGLSFRRRNFPEEGKNLENFPIAAQEQLLLEDLLFALHSIEGTYIKRKQEENEDSKVFTFAVEPYLDKPTCDESLLYLISKILPLCVYHDQVSTFLNIHSNYAFGLVSHALCEAISSLLKEYSLKITQIDAEFVKGDMTIQKLWFYLQPCLRTMESLTKFVNEAENLKGGAMLNEIYRCMTSASDPQNKRLFSFLMEKSSVPYLEMLSTWIHYGEIDDPYEEFLIKEQKEHSKENLNRDFNDNYWDKRFEFRESQVPLFLQKLTGKVLFTGKYLNVIRECGKTVECPYADELDPKKNPKLLSNIGNHRDFIEPIEHAYEWASQRLLTLILEEEQLMSRLKSIKHYFFLDLGDFFVHFMDSAEDELAKHIRMVSREKLESLLDLSLRTSSANFDKFKEDVTCELQSYTLLEQLYAMHNIVGNLKPNAEASPIFTVAQSFKGLEAFVLDYKVRWPLTLIISHKALMKYQLIFRHLFFCKWVERQLCSTWLLHQSTKELDVQGAFSASYCLRQRMLHFVKNYVYYMEVEVLEEKWHSFSEKLKTATTIDEIMNFHTVFLDECLKECLLMDYELFMVLNKTIWSCAYFAEMVQKYIDSAKVEDPLFSQVIGSDLSRPKSTYSEKRSAKIKEESSVTGKVLAKKRYNLMIEEYSKRFDEFLKQFLQIIHKSRSRSEVHLINLVIRLDYNGFYSQKLLEEK